MTDTTLDYSVQLRRGQRRIILHVRDDNTLLVTGPRGTRRAQLTRFVESQTEWIAKRRAQNALKPQRLEPGPEAEQHKAWIREQLDDLMPAWCARMGVTAAPRVTLRIMRTRWGSCNPQLVRISLNVELARYGRAALEYVLVHELAHLFESSHGPAFYAIMDAHLPDWRARRAALKQIPPAGR
ncbi:M48 family metallopeptidase [Demequina sediminicola]|uniref:M48 family metallopeptidase n=1 Tax=Demequina sediminicola TaxID=1095026 RepID=UPI000785B75E|nr:M48 family metallopeptidase [Demequina sediminicola]